MCCRGKRERKHINTHNIIVKVLDIHLELIIINISTLYVCHILCYCICLCEYVCVWGGWAHFSNSTSVEYRGQLSKVSSLLPSCVPQALNLGH